MFVLPLMPQLMPAFYLNLLTWFAVLYLAFFLFHTLIVFPYVLLTHVSRYTLLFS